MERTVALGLSGSASLALLDACGTGTSSTSLTYWNLFGGGDGVRMVQMQNDFASAHPEVNLEAITLAWGEPYYTKLAMAAAGGRPPDVAISHMTRMIPLAQGGLLDPIDLNELARYGITQNDFLARLWQNAHYNGQPYAVPLDTHPFVMYYNTDICKRANLLDANGNLKPIQGPDALISALKAAQQASNGGWGLALSIANADVTTWRLFYTLYSQLGGKVLSANNQQLVLDQAKASQVVSFMNNLTLTSKVALPTADYGGANALFASGKAGFYFEGEWEVTTFLTAKTPFNMAPFPNVFGGGQSQADSHTFVLPRQISLDPARRAAAYEFISYLLKDSLVWAHGGHIPAYLPVATSSAYQQLKPQSNYAQVASNVVIDPPAWFSGSGSEFETVMSSALQASLEGQLSATQAVQQFSTGTQQLLDIPSPV
jgi:multiple sugar transport system substrate-binding protein